MPPPGNLSCYSTKALVILPAIRTHWSLFLVRILRAMQLNHDTVYVKKVRNLRTGANGALYF